MLLNVGTEKMGNERKSNADISFLFFYIINYFSGKCLLLCSSLVLFVILRLEKIMSKTSVRNVARVYSKE